MKPLLLSLLLAITNQIPAQDKDPSGGIFDFSDLDVLPSEIPKEDPTTPSPEGEDPVAGFPEEVQSILKKLSTFEVAKRAGVNQQIVAGRKIGAEILAKRAASAAADGRAVLLERANWLENLPPHEVLEGAGQKKDTTKPAWFLTSWKCPAFGWTNLHATGGDVYRKGRVRGRWRWLDQKNLVCVFNYDDGYVEVCQFENKASPTKAKIVNMNGPTYGLERVEAPQKSGLPPKAGQEDPVAKLATSEGTLREKTETLIVSKQTKVAAWMLQLAPKLKGEQVRLVVERAALLERKAPPEALKPGESFGGIWSWQGKTLEFRDGGILFVGGKKAGRWLEGRGDYRTIAFSLEDQKTAAVGRVSGDDKNVLRVSLLSGARSEATRK